MLNARNLESPVWQGFSGFFIHQPLVLIHQGLPILLKLHMIVAMAADNWVSAVLSGVHGMSFSGIMSSGMINLPVWGRLPLIVG